MAAAMSDLNLAQAQLDEKQRELDAVQAMYDKAMREKQALIDDANNCRRKMAAASELINGLGDEKIRWVLPFIQRGARIAQLVKSLDLLSLDHRSEPVWALSNPLTPNC